MLDPRVVARADGHSAAARSRPWASGGPRHTHVIVSSPSTNGSRVAGRGFTVLSRHEPGSGWTRTLPEKALDIGRGQTAY